ncbi:hypothetical protein FO519_006773 [Halicephalobus sp. NKZ332]|nr:hypothetical protein FO519_006773 [Halicephalobus sp. NKZ332]
MADSNKQKDKQKDKQTKKNTSSKEIAPENNFEVQSSQSSPREDYPQNFDLRSRSVPRAPSIPRDRPAFRARSMSRAPSVLCVPEKEVPTDRYRLEENKDRSKYAAVLVLEKDNPEKAKEFHYRYPTHNKVSTVFCCPYCYKNFLRYNKDEDKLYWLRDEKDHEDGFKCLAYPLEVLMEKYDRPRRNCPSSNGWWKKMAKEYGFSIVKRYHSARKRIENGE